jgi:hypothetical protein
VQSCLAHRVQTISCCMNMPGSHVCSWACAWAARAASVLLLLATVTGASIGLHSPVCFTARHQRIKFL